MSSRVVNRHELSKGQKVDDEVGPVHHVPQVAKVVDCAALCELDALKEAKEDDQAKGNVGVEPDREDRGAVEDARLDVVRWKDGAEG